jgi:hypothetical protein
MVMIDVDLDADRLRVHFTPTETLLGLVHDLDVPLSEVQSVQRLRDPWPPIHGRHTGSGLRGVWMLGTWSHRDHRQLVALRRDQEALQIRMRSGHYRELLVCTPHPDVVEERLARHGVRTDRLAAL